MSVGVAAVKCPYCREDIANEAKKCRFCNEWLDPSARPPESSQEKSGDPNSQICAIIKSKWPDFVTAFNSWSAKGDSETRENARLNLIPIQQGFKQLEAMDGKSELSGLEAAIGVPGRIRALATLLAVPTTLNTYMQLKNSSGSPDLDLSIAGLNSQYVEFGHAIQPMSPTLAVLLKAVNGLVNLGPQYTLLSCCLLNDADKTRTEDVALAVFRQHVSILSVSRTAGEATIWPQKQLQQISLQMFPKRNSQFLEISGPDVTGVEQRKCVKISMIAEPQYFQPASKLLNIVRPLTITLSMAEPPH